MKTLKLIVLSVLASTLLLACKKGEEDPFLSLKTRDARITGKWKLVEAEEIYMSSYAWVNSGPDNDPDNNTTVLFEEKSERTFKDGKMFWMDTETITFGDSVTVYSDESEPVDYSAEMSIKKLGQVEFIESSEGDLRTSSENWYWLDSDKKKTQIELDGILFTVLRLTNSELKLTYTEKESYEDDEYKQEETEEEIVTRTYTKLK